MGKYLKKLSSCAIEREFTKAYKNLIIKIDSKVEISMGSMSGRDPQMNTHTP